jgi:hypothetical protein
MRYQIDKDFKGSPNGWGEPIDYKAGTVAEVSDSLAESALNAGFISPIDSAKKPAPAPAPAPDETQEAPAVISLETIKEAFTIPEMKDFLDEAEVKYNKRAKEAGLAKLILKHELWKGKI